MSREHSTFDNTLADVQLTPKPQMCERSSRIIYAVVMPPVHHSGDDLVRD